MKQVGATGQGGGVLILQNGGLPFRGNRVAQRVSPVLDRPHLGSCELPALLCHSSCFVHRRTIDTVSMFQAMRKVRAR